MALPPPIRLVQILSQPRPRLHLTRLLRLLGVQPDSRSVKLLVLQGNVNENGWRQSKGNVGPRVTVDGHCLHENILPPMFPPARHFPPYFFFCPVIGDVGTRASYCGLSDTAGAHPAAARPDRPCRWVTAPRATTFRGRTTSWPSRCLAVTRAARVAQPSAPDDGAGDVGDVAMGVRCTRGSSCMWHDSCGACE